MASEKPITEIPADEILRTLAEEHFGVTPEVFSRITSWT